MSRSRHRSVRNCIDRGGSSRWRPAMAVARAACAISVRRTAAAIRLRVAGVAGAGHVRHGSAGGDRTGAIQRQSRSRGRRSRAAQLGRVRRHHAQHPGTSADHTTRWR
ncbi:MAG: hypothetical protein MZU84_04265 [Sphingobacterium sp.]|nr:hypothetical protein [Sphingobacterium sp.]